MKTCRHDESVSCSVTMRFASEAAAHGAQELLLSTVACTNAKNECLDCRMVMESSDPGYIRYTEQWSSEAAFVVHAASGEFRRVLNAIDLCSEMPEVKVERLFTDNGLECFQQILQQAAGGSRTVDQK